jgi:hypothetical protein
MNDIDGAAITIRRALLERLPPMKRERWLAGEYRAWSTAD